MKYKLLKYDNEYHLLFATGEMKMLTIEQVQAFILNFDSFEFDGSTNSFSTPLFDKNTGEHLATLSDDLKLTLHSAAFLRELFFDESAYLSIQQFAEKHGRKRAIVSRLCNDGRILGAVRKGPRWYIPKDASYPVDGRVNRDMSSKYLTVEKTPSKQ